MSDSYVRTTQEFFSVRAADWEDRFPDDDVVYAAGVREFDPPRGGVVVDVGCGTGRALDPLRAAVGGDGVVIGIDATPEMLRVAHDKGRTQFAGFALADSMRLPFASDTVDAYFAAGMIVHVPDPQEWLRELARCARPDCRLALFHPIGRAALARRHRGTLRPDELLDPSVLPGVLARAGWTTDHIDDAEHRYLARARKTA